MIVNAHGARAGIFNYLTGRAICQTPRPDDEAEALLDKHRTETLTEGAALIENAACDADWDRRAGYCQGLRAGAELLLAKTVETADATAGADASDFFRPGRTYAHTMWRFHCGTVTAHPATGERSALGWLQISDGSWTTYAYSAEAWGDGWTDVTEEGGE